jgi:glycosyltransferase involved in cell wall biosynthesis
MDEAMTISVAMAVYNGERFVNEQLASFVRQIRTPDEMVISDDCSTDRSLEIIKNFARTAPFPVKVLSNRRNERTNANFQRAIEACAGDLIFMADCDDVQYPEKIAVMENALRQSPKAGIALCNADLVNDHLDSLKRTLWETVGFSPSRRSQRLMAQGRLFVARLATNGCAIAFRAKFKDLILPLPMGNPRPLIWDAFIVWTILLSGAGGVALVQKPLFAYRQHPAQLSGVGGSLDSWFELIAMRLRRRGSRPPLGLLIDRLQSPAASKHCISPLFREAALRHLRARWLLPPNRLARWPVVLRELLTLRYHRFSAGLGAAAKDLVFVK